MFVVREGYASGEYIKTGSSLLVLVQGVVSRGGAILTHGAFWGDVMLARPILRDTRDAKTLAYTEVARVSRDAITKVAAAYPASAARLRHAALMLATKRSIVLTALVARIVSHKKRLPEDLAQYRATLQARLAVDAASSDGKDKSKAVPLGRWGRMRAAMPSSTSNFLSRLRGLRRQKGTLTFENVVKPVSDIKPTGILRAMESALNADESGGDASKPAPAWREVQYDADGKPIGLLEGGRDAAALNDANGRVHAKGAPAGARRNGRGRGLSSKLASASAATATLIERVDAMMARMEAMEATRQADAREVLLRLTRLEQAHEVVPGAQRPGDERMAVAAPVAGVAALRRACVTPFALSEREAFLDDARASSAASIEGPPSRMRRTGNSGATPAPLNAALLDSPDNYADEGYYSA
jgi:hypothetical protein